MNNKPFKGSFYISYYLLFLQLLLLIIYYSGLNQFDFLFFRFQCNDLTVYMGATDEFFLACPNIFLYTKEEANGIKSNGIFEKIIFFQDSESNQERFKTCNAEGKHNCFVVFECGNLRMIYIHKSFFKSVKILNLIIGLTSKVEHSCSPNIGKPYYQVTADDFEAKTFVFSKFVSGMIHHLLLQYTVFGLCV